MRTWHALPPTPAPVEVRLDDPCSTFGRWDGEKTGASGTLRAMRAEEKEGRRGTGGTGPKLLDGCWRMFDIKGEVRYPSFGPARVEPVPAFLIGPNAVPSKGWGEPTDRFPSGAPRRGAQRSESRTRHPWAVIIQTVMGGRCGPKGWPSRGEKDTAG